MGKWGTSGTFHGSLRGPKTSCTRHLLWASAVTCFKGEPVCPRNMKGQKYQAGGKLSPGTLSQHANSNEWCSSHQHTCTLSAEPAAAPSRCLCGDVSRSCCTGMPGVPHGSPGPVVVKPMCVSYDVSSQLLESGISVLFTFLPRQPSFWRRAWQHCSFRVCSVPASS